MARIAGVNIPNHQHTVIGLTAIYGVGRPRSQKICDATGVATNKKVKDLDDNELEKLRDATSGVSADEEAASMMRYQSAYQANARFFSTVTNMLDELLKLVS